MGMLVKTTGRVFPGILHIDADVVATFNFDSLHFEHGISAGNFDHAAAAPRAAAWCFDFNHLLRQRIPFVEHRQESGVAVIVFIRAMNFCIASRSGAVR